MQSFTLLKLGAVSPSPRARRKAISMDEMSLSENLTCLDDVVAKNVAEKNNSEAHVIRDGVRVRRQLPELELEPLPRSGAEQRAPLLHPGLEQRAETLKKKHFERVLSRALSEVRSEEAKIDLNVSPAARFLLQVMPWELTPPVTPITTPAAVPFIWEDVPGRSKSLAIPSPCPSLPLPPRLVRTRPFSSSSASFALAGSSLSEPTQFISGDLLPSAATTGKTTHVRRHRKNMHSWHVLHNFFAGSNQQCALQSTESVTVDTDKESDNSSVLRPEDSTFVRGETSTDGASVMSTCINSNSTSSDLSPNITTSSEENFSSCETGLTVCYELPPLYKAPLSPFTPPYKGLGPLDDDDGSKQTKRLHNLAKWFRQVRGRRREVSRGRLFLNRFKKRDKVTGDCSSYLLNDAKGGQMKSKGLHGEHVNEQTPVWSEVAWRIQKTRNVSSQMSPIAASLYQSPNRGMQKSSSAFRSTKFFIRLRRRGSRVIVASYRAIKQALFLKRAHNSKHHNLSQLPYQALGR
ncbi:hypothetical protein L7F22_042933 [Adiantum nelumboides]|nr:hypothetical protein [Adiantum nelumboides]